jgi:hypothetical protein
MRYLAALALVLVACGGAVDVEDAGPVDAALVDAACPRNCHEYCEASQNCTLVCAPPTWCLD